MDKHILVPLDGSTLAERAIPHALSIARLTSSAITLLRSVPPAYVAVPMGGGFAASSDVWQAAAEEPGHAQEYLAALAARLRLEQAGLVVETAVLEVEPASAIVHFAEQHPGVRLIAMATHGRSGLSRWVFGSVAEKVLQGAPVPLLLIRPTHAEGATTVPARHSPTYGKILVPLDGSEFAEHALEHAEEIAANSDAILLLLAVEAEAHDRVMTETKSGVGWVTAPWEENRAEEYLREVARQCLDAQNAPTQDDTATHPQRLRVQTQTSYGDPAEEILKVGAQGGVDMIVMSTHGRGGLKRLWLGSVAMKVVRGATMPVLLVRSKERVGVHEAQRKAAALAYPTIQTMA